jgi:hypothetical protein
MIGVELSSRTLPRLEIQHVLGPGLQHRPWLEHGKASEWIKASFGMASALA